MRAIHPRQATQRGAEKVALFRPLPHPPETGNGLRPADASESVRGIGAKINAEVCAAKSAQRFAVVDCAGGITWRG